MRRFANVLSTRRSVVKRTVRQNPIPDAAKWWCGRLAMVVCLLGLVHIPTRALAEPLNHGIILPTKTSLMSDVKSVFVGNDNKSCSSRLELQDGIGERANGCAGPD